MPAVNWDRPETWPPMDSWTTEDRCQATAWLIRDFTSLDFRVEPGEGGGLRVYCSEHFRYPSAHPEDVLHFLEGFHQGCEVMAAEYIYPKTTEEEING